MADKIDVEAVRGELFNGAHNGFIVGYERICRQALALIDQLTAERDEKKAEISELRVVARRVQAAYDDRDVAFTRAEQAEAERDALQAKVDAMQGAIEPFASFAAHAVDSDGWKGRIGHERICDWFGPSDFKPFLPAPADPLDDLWALANSCKNAAEFGRQFKARNLGLLNTAGIEAAHGSVTFGDG